MFRNSEDIPPVFVDALYNACDMLIFRNIYKMLTIWATPAVTVSSVERTFSTLKRLKTYSRNSCTENRLNGLAALSIHREIQLNLEEIIDIFAKENRKLSLL